MTWPNLRSADALWQAVALLGSLSHEGMYFLRRPGPELAYMNPAGERLLGASLEELRALEDMVTQRVHPDDRAQVIKGREDPTAVRWPMEIRWRQHTDRFVRLWIHEVPVTDSDGEIVATVGLFRAIHRDDADEALLRDALTREQVVADRLRELDDMRHAFLRSISHELRTPLTAILGYADTLQLHHDQLTEKQFDRVVDRIMGNAERLRTMLDDLLDIDRMSRGTLTINMEVVRLGEIVAHALEHVSAGRVRVNTTPVYVEVDPAKLERVVDSLVSNSFKHGGANVIVHVEVRPDGDDALLTVWDNGVGFEESVLASGRGFTPFEQGTASLSAASPGAGLGLTFVRQVVALHGGTVELRNRDVAGDGQRGAEVLIRFPACSPPDA